MCSCRGKMIKLVKGGDFMDRIGFIGYGSMGSMLVKGLIGSGQVRQEQIIVTRKDKSRLDEIKKTWPEINVARNAADTAKDADYIFICVKPLEYLDILKEIKPFIRPDHHIVLIAGAVAVEDIQKMADCKITKVIPTVLSEVREGITLVCHNGRVTEEDSAHIGALLGSIGRIWRIDEKDFGFATELTSCGPGLIAAVFQELVEAGLRHTDRFGRDEITEMVLQTMYGTSRLILEKKMDFRDVITRVATRGGITEEGVKVIEKGLPQVFDEMLDQCMRKREAVNGKILYQFRDIQER